MIEKLREEYEKLERQKKEVSRRESSLRNGERAYTRTAIGILVGLVTGIFSIININWILGVLIIFFAPIIGYFNGKKQDKVKYKNVKKEYDKIVKMCGDKEKELINALRKAYSKNANLNKYCSLAASAFAKQIVDAPRAANVPKIDIENYIYVRKDSLIFAVGKYNFEAIFELERWDNLDADYEREALVRTVAILVAEAVSELYPMDLSGVKPSVTYSIKQGKYEIREYIKYLNEYRNVEQPQCIGTVYYYCHNGNYREKTKLENAK